MSGRIFQNIVLQFKETTDTVIGVIDSEGTVIACTDLPEIGQRWPHLVQPINEAEGACTALEGKTFKALEGWGGQFDFAAFTRRGRAQLDRLQHGDRRAQHRQELLRGKARQDVVCQEHPLR